MILNDFFKSTEWTTGQGIFYYLQNTSVPWADDDINVYLDLMYHGNRSGQKIVTPLLEYIESNAENKQKIANLIYARFADKWNNIYNTLETEYSLTSDYSITETETRTGTATENTTANKTTEDNGTLTTADSKTTTDTGTVGTVSETETSNSGTDNRTRTPNLTTTTTENTALSNTSANQNGIYGFNSTDLVGTDAQNGSSTGTEDHTNTTTETGTETDNTSTSASGTEEITGTVTNNLTKTETGTNTVTNDLEKTETGTGTKSGTNSLSISKTRSGLMGKKTILDLMDDSLKFWQYDFFDVVFRDIDKILTIMVY